MIMSYEQILRYWLDEPSIETAAFRQTKDGLVFNPSGVCFPDLDTMTAEWKESYRLLLELHPEYSSAIVSGTRSH